VSENDAHPQIAVFLRKINFNMEKKCLGVPYVQTNPCPWFWWEGKGARDQDFVGVWIKFEDSGAISFSSVLHGIKAFGFHPELVRAIPRGRLS
jgi:hypothetical protein